MAGMSLGEALALEGGSEWLAHPRGEVFRRGEGWAEWSRVMGGVEYRFVISPPVAVGAGLMLPGTVEVMTYSRRRGCWQSRRLWTF